MYERRRRWLNSRKKWSLGQTAIFRSQQKKLGESSFCLNGTQIFSRHRMLSGMINHDHESNGSLNQMIIKLITCIFGTSADFSWVEMTTDRLLKLYSR